MPANYKFIYNRRKRTDSAGKASVELRISLNRKAKYIATGIRIDPKYWDETKTQVRKTHGNYMRINFILNEILQKVKDAEFKFITEKVNYDLDTLVQVLNKKTNAPVYFPDWCMRVLDDKGHLKKSTKVKQRSVLNHLKAFNPKLKFSDINYSFFMQLDAYLHKQRNPQTGEPFKQNTIHGQIKIIKSYIKTAYQADLINKIPDYKVPVGKVHKEALSLPEIEAIEELDFGHEPELERSKDVFLFSCYTAIRFSDIKKLTKKNVKENGRLKFISEKTDTELELPLDKLFDGKPLEIIQKYLEEDAESLFSIKTNQAVNRHLKVIRVAAKIDKPLTFHIARHTCLTVLGKKTGNPYLIMRIAGHSDIKTSMQYTKGVIDDDLFRLL